LFVKREGPRAIDARECPNAAQAQTFSFNNCNAPFWASLPKPRQTPFPSQYLAKSKLTA